MKTLKQLTILLAALLLCTAAAGCGKPEQTDPPVTTETQAAAPGTENTETDETEPEAESAEETEAESETEPAEETEAESETEPETEITLPNEAELVENPVTTPTTETDEPAETEAAAAAESETEPAAETETEASEEKEPEVTRIYDYLNGKTVTAEQQARRPVAIMVNNIKNCLPQDSISAGDMFYECAAEGGITRIMMLVSDYDKLGVVGSVRSSRDYFVDFLANHNAIYVHAGGSEMAYDKIQWRGINNLDGVNMYLPNTFYRDTYRWNNMGMEHSLMATGEGIVSGIASKGYTTVQDESYTSPFAFYDETVDNQLVGSPASHVHMKSTAVQTVDFVYNEETGEYLRYQYNGMPHVDGLTGEQLSLKNVIILFTDIDLIPGDTAGRLTVNTVGSGEGYYITNGKRKVIKWSRDGKTTPVHLEYRNGDELILNSGKTFICVVDTSVAAGIDFEYQW